VAFPKLIDQIKETESQKSFLKVNSISEAPIVQPVQVVVNFNSQFEAPIRRPTMYQTKENSFVRVPENPPPVHSYTRTEKK
jgi:hypothetical protein